jgi:hypothetical protein
MRPSVGHETRAAICWIVLAVVPLVSVDCGGDSASADGSSLSAVDGQFVDCATETRATPYAAGTVVQSSDGQFAVTLVDNRPGEAAANNPPGTWVKGSNTWDIQVRDTAGQPVDGLTIDTMPRMPDHGHGTSITPETTDDGGGKYVISPLYLYMGGYWQVTLNIRVPLSDGGAGAALHNDSAVFNVCIPG